MTVLFIAHWYMHGGGSVHTFHWLVPPATYFDTNPEYYSLIGDQRRWKDAQLCLSNLEVAQVAANRAIASLRGAGPTRRMIEISAMDWTGHCECKNWRAINEATGGYSGLLLTFVNRVAELVAAKVPDAARCWPPAWLRTIGTVWSFTARARPGTST